VTLTWGLSGQETPAVTKLSLKPAQNEQKWRNAKKTENVAISRLAKGFS